MVAPTNHKTDHATTTSSVNAASNLKRSARERVAMGTPVKIPFTRLPRCAVDRQASDLRPMMPENPGPSPILRVCLAQSKEKWRRGAHLTLYVFGYGSLMWRPDFPYVSRQLATVRGRHRRLCVYSWVHRGTEARPGLVLGLDRGGACRGVLFEVAADHAEATLTALRAREQVTNVYLERTVHCRCDDQTVVQAITYVVDRNHAQYAGRLPAEETLNVVRGAVGRSGANEDYVISTADHLAEVGIDDAPLAALAAALRRDLAA